MANPLYGLTGGTPGPTGYGNQEPTLNETRRGPVGLLPRERLELTRGTSMVGRWFGDWYSKMDDMKEQPQRRREWYVQKLGKYHSQLQESATANRIPLQLLAAIVLNELADIDQKDVLQQQLISNLNSGSLGMAQIEVQTALDHDLLSGFLTSRHAGAAAQLLAIPQYSIEAAAREIRHLLDQMEKNPSGPWASHFKFVPPDSNDQDPARYYRQGGTAPNANSNQEASEAELARMVASAYNGGDKFLDSEDPQKTKPNSAPGFTGRTQKRSPATWFDSIFSALRSPTRVNDA